MNGKANGTYATNGSDGAKGRLARAILQASPAMPDAEAHYRWLVGRDQATLEERLKQIQEEK